MDMNNVNIEEIVKQVLSGMTGNAPAAQAAPAATAAPTADPVIPKTAHVAMLTAWNTMKSRNSQCRKLAMTISLLKLKDAVSAVLTHTNSREIHLV